MSNRFTSIDSDQAVANSVVGDGGGWDGGWYVYEDGVVVGPLTSAATFTPQRLTATGQAGMVSRKGFTQWYAVQSFSEIYSRPSGIASGQNNLESQKKLGRNRFEPVAKEMGPAGSKKLKAAQIDLSAQSSFESSAVAATVPKHKQQRQAPAPVLDFDQKYLRLYGRLRLGRITNAGVAAFIYTPLTIGGYWWAWMATSSQEVSWHLNGASKMNFVVPMWACLIPGVHLVVAFLLARMVLQMELQNGYKTVNPILATVAAIFPPFYIYMIQKALNRHWRSHVLDASI
jgi:hypothetical protein